MRETLKLELSEEKTLITHARTGAAKFLGYQIVIQHADDKLDRRGQRQVNETIGLRVPKEVIEQKCAFYMQRGKPAQRAQLLDDSDYSIVSKYQAEYRGIVQYYLLAHNVGLVRQIAMGSRNVAAQNAWQASISPQLRQWPSKYKANNARLPMAQENASRW